MVQPDFNTTKPKIKSKTKLRKLNKYRLLGILIAILTYLIVTAIMFLSLSPKKYDVNIGDIAPESIKATEDVVDKIATQQLLDESKARVMPEYQRDDKIEEESLKELESIFASISSIRIKADKHLKEWKESEKQHSMQASGGTIVNNSTQNSAEDNLIEDASNDEDSQNLSNEVDYSVVYDESYIDSVKDLIDINLSDEDFFTVLTAKEDELMSLKNALSDLILALYANDIKQDDLVTFKRSLREEISGLPLSNNVRQLGTSIGTTLVTPNMSFDYDATQNKKELAAASVEKVVYKKGQYIVEEGKPVSENQIAILEELGLLKKNKLDISIMIGTGLIVLLIEIVGILFLSKFHKQTLKKTNEQILMSIVFCIVLALSYVVIKYFETYLVPFAMVGMLVTILIHPSIAIIESILFSPLIALMMPSEASGIILVCMLSNIFAIYLVTKSQKRNALIIAGILSGAVNMTVIFGIKLIQQAAVLQALTVSLWGMASGVIASILTIGTLPIWENLFSIITPLKLMELADSNHPLLKRLLIEAPGTYHHSILVANLAENAATSIGANSLLARTGAYYHDIGKLKRPYYFRENQMSDDNPHDRINPNLSTNIIISHAKDGAEMARQYRLPKAIIEFVMQHHGDTAVKYFYHKAKEMADDNNDIVIDDFRYPGPKPQSPELAIVMMADTVEAAVRAMKEPTRGKIKGLIRKLIKDKLEDGQFDECDLTLKNLDIIASAFEEVMNGMYHERIEYPEAEFNKEKERTADA